MKKIFKILDYSMTALLYIRILLGSALVVTQMKGYMYTVFVEAGNELVQGGYILSILFIFYGRKVLSEKMYSITRLSVLVMVMIALFFEISLLVAYLRW